MRDLTATSDRLQFRQNEINNLIQKHDARSTTYKCITYVVWSEEKFGEKVFTKVWVGTAYRSEFYSHSTPEKAFAYINRCVDFADKKEASTANYKAEKKAANSVNNLEIGNILYTSWGYEQTNVDFYEVVGKPSALMVEVRKIGHISCGADGLSSMADMVKPDKGAFIGGVEKYRVMNGNTIRVGGSYKTTAHIYGHGDRGVYCSWYA